jgi:hypothetical protein
LVAFCLEKKILLCRELTGGKEGRNGAVGSAVYILGALATRAQPFVWFFSAGFGLSRENIKPEQSPIQQDIAFWTFTEMDFDW